VFEIGQIFTIWLHKGQVPSPGFKGCGLDVCWLLVWVWWVIFFQFLWVWAKI